LEIELKAPAERYIYRKRQDKRLELHRSDIFFYVVPTELGFLFGNLSYKHIVPNGTLNFQTGSYV